MTVTYLGNTHYEIKVI